MNQRKDELVILDQKLLEMVAARGLSLGLRHQARAGKGLVYLPIEFPTVGHNQEGPIPRHPAHDLLAKEHHRQALAAPLGMPEDA